MLRISLLIAVIALTATIASPGAQAKGACYDAQKCNADCQRSSNVGKSCQKMCDHQQATLPPCK